MTNTQKHEIFKREVSAMLLESASWNDRPLEEYKDITIEVFLADYIFDGILYDCLEKDEDFRVGDYTEYIEDFNVIRNSLWYSGAIADYYNRKGIDPTGIVGCNGCCEACHGHDHDHEEE